MPQADNLVVKNGAATPADVTFTLMSPSAGDGGIAEWVLKSGQSSQEFVRFTALASRTAKGRSLKLKLKIPLVYTDANTGLQVVYAHTEVNATYSVPAAMPESAKADYVAYATNLLATPLVKSMVRDALSAT